jgi:hypothetical protein
MIARDLYNKFALSLQNVFSLLFKPIEIDDFYVIRITSKYIFFDNRSENPSFKIPRTIFEDNWRRIVKSEALVVSFKVYDGLNVEINNSHGMVTIYFSGHAHDTLTINWSCVNQINSTLEGVNL